VVSVTIELCQLDDEFAGSGWLFLLWVLSLARGPSIGDDRVVLGYHGLSRRRSPHLVYSDADGITDNGRWTFSELDAALHDATTATPH
jgi:hypothetical protein